jgi:hypothetical protein
MISTQGRRVVGETVGINMNRRNDLVDGGGAQIRRGRVVLRVIPLLFDVQY